MTHICNLSALIDYWLINRLASDLFFLKVWASDKTIQHKAAGLLLFTILAEISILFVSPHPCGILMRENGSASAARIKGTDLVFGILRF